MIAGLIAAIGGLLAYVLFLIKKKNSAEAINENFETKKQINDLEKQKLPDPGKETREAIKKQFEDENNVPKSAEELANLFTDMFNNKGGKSDGDKG